MLVVSHFNHTIIGECVRPTIDISGPGDILADDVMSSKVNQVHFWHGFVVLVLCKC